MFADDLESTTAGRYYRCPADTPFVAGWHHYGSREWYETNWQHIQGLGEDLVAKHKWNPGTRPAILPENRVLGSLTCIANGGQIANRLPYAQIFDGLPRACFAPGSLPDLTWPMVSTYTSCSLQFFYATVLLWMYDHAPGPITTAFQMLVPGCVVTWKEGTALFPDLICVTTANWTVLVSDGTQTYQQWAMQGFGGITPPTNFGGYATLPLWYYASQRAIDFMTECGANASGKFMLVGHSYGGASIYNVAARLRRADATRTIHTLSFGSPKPGDTRMFGILNTTSGMAMANDQDIVCAVPPDFTTLFPVLGITGLIGLTVWDLWQHPPDRALQDSTGALTLNATPILDTGYLLSLLAKIFAHLPFDDVLTHPTAVYRQRIFDRCPEPEWPIDEPLWDFLRVKGDVGLTAIGPPALGEIGLTVGEFVGGEIGLTGGDLASGEIGLGLDPEGAGGEIGLTDDALAGEIGLGEEPEGAGGEIGLTFTDFAGGEIGLGEEPEGAGGEIGLSEDETDLPATGDMAITDPPQPVDGGDTCEHATDISLGVNYITIPPADTLVFFRIIDTPPSAPADGTLWLVHPDNGDAVAINQGECDDPATLDVFGVTGSFPFTTITTVANTIFVTMRYQTIHGPPYAVEFRVTFP